VCFTCHNTSLSKYFCYALCLELQHYIVIQYMRSLARESFLDFFFSALADDDEDDDEVSILEWARDFRSTINQVSMPSSYANKHIPSS
jgi:hypothetical protein